MTNTTDNIAAARKMRDLIDRLNTYRNAYYNENKSLVSDRHYDYLFDVLSQMEKETGITYPDSPTQTVGYEVVSKLQKVRHDHPLLSLDKETDMTKFASYFGDRSVCLMAKMDGLTASIRYVGGKLVSAESRGDGEVGEDITHTAKTFVNLPQTISFNGELVVDGECVIDRDTFDKINETEHTEYKNPRNLVSGTVRQLDSKIAANRKVRFIAWKLYRIVPENGEKPLYNSDKYMSIGFYFLKSLGFEVAPYRLLTQYSPDTYDKLQMFHLYIDEIKQLCETMKYPIDGIVGAFNDISYGESLGSTGHHPKHSLAYKFYQERNKTHLLDIEWNTSRTGLVNPVAIVEPVEIDGTTVSRASLSNVSIIKELELGIEDELTVIKANQIIPMVTDNLTRSNTYQLPTVCPCCGKKLTIRNDTGRETLVCTNQDCFAVKQDRLANFVARDAMNIIGISGERILTLMNLGFLSDFQSIYRLKSHKDELIALDGFGKSSVENMLAAIEKSRHCKFANVLVAIGIPGIGKSAAKSIARYCLSFGEKNVLKKFIKMACENYNWTVLDNFGDILSGQINDYVQNNLEMIEPLADILVIEENGTAVSSDNRFFGKTFCITGKLFKYPNRDALVGDIETRGGKVVSSVSAKTDYLITNEPNSGSSKNEKARKFGTEIITEDQFIKMMS